MKNLLYNCLHKDSLYPYSLIKWKLWRSKRRECSIKKGVLNFFIKSIGKDLCQKLFSQKSCPLQVFPCHFCKVFKNIFFRNTYDRLFLALMKLTTVINFRWWFWFFQSFHLSKNWGNLPILRSFTFS